MSVIAYAGTLYGYSWRITNETGKDLFVYLGTNNPASKAPIGSSKKGTLLKAGESTGGSEKFPNTFSDLVVGVDESFSKPERFRLDEAANINYSIKKKIEGFDTYRQHNSDNYTLVDNNNVDDVERRKKTERMIGIEKGEIDATKEDLKDMLSDLIAKIDNQQPPANVIEKLRFLIKKGADIVNTKTPSTRSFYDQRVNLFEASLNNKDIIEFLIKEADLFDSKWRGDDNINPMVRIMRSSLPTAVKKSILAQYIKSQGVDSDNVQEVFFSFPRLDGERTTSELLMPFIAAGFDINKKNKQGQTLLHLATSQGFIDTIKGLVKNNAGLYIMNNEGNTPLDLAAKGYLPSTILSALLGSADLKKQQELGLDINKKNEEGQTLLHVAGADVDNIKILVTNGADASIKDSKGNTPSALVIKIENIDRASGALSALLNYVDFNKERYVIHGIPGNTILHYLVEKVAGSKSYDAIFKIFREKKEFKELINVANSKGETPLHIASKQGDLLTVDALLDAGAAVDAVNRLGQTPLVNAAQAAVSSSNAKSKKALVDIVKHLLYRGADEKGLKDLLSKDTDIKAIYFEWKQKQPLNK
jgi:ankyrin repeat protein